MTKKAWHQVLTLREDIKSGALSQKEFAADLYDVIMDRNRSIYHDPVKFFELTYPTTRLLEMAKNVVLRLAGKSDRSVRLLDLTYGGGKSHSLITLFHLVHDPSTLPTTLPAVNEFRQHIGVELPRTQIAALAFDKLDLGKGMEVLSPSREARWLKMPWSILAWQLAGEEGLLTIGGEKEERRDPPKANLLEDLLALPGKKGLATLVLFDETLMWVRDAVDIDENWLGRFQNFCQYLTQAVTKVDRCCMVASLLATDPGRSDELGRKITAALDVVFSRVADEKILPVEKQDVAEVLRRRMFTPDSYGDRSGWRQQVLAAINGIADLDDLFRKNRSQEDERFLASYPFHPDLTEVLYGKWSMLENFQLTRGVLRVFALALRDAVSEGDNGVLVGPQVFLQRKGQGALPDALRELASIARLEQVQGRSQNWEAILTGELTKAQAIQDEIAGLKGRELEQSVVATFLHSQPIGQRASLRELMILVGASNPDKIEIRKGLASWVQVSWYLDDSFAAEKDQGLPKVWRLGSKPNLKQMHSDARLHVGGSVVEARLIDEIAGAKKLTEGARGEGARVHVLPDRPSDVENDGEFHYAILGPKAGSESGKPSAEAKRFIDETTGPETPRSKNRNAVVLVVPSKDGIEIAKEKIRDHLAWEYVRDSLKSQEIDPIRSQQLDHSIRAARAEIASSIILAYCIVVTVNEKNEVIAFRINPDNEALFPKVRDDKRARVSTKAIEADAILPGGPYNLWQPGEKRRYVKDLIGWFAQTAAAPKVLNTKAIVDTLLLGCKSGSFALQVTRADKSFRTFWKTQPDDAALTDSSLEVVLTEAVHLTEIEQSVLAPGVLPELWKGDLLKVGDAYRFFSGTTVVQVDKGGYKEPLLIPAAGMAVVNAAVASAVKSGTLWFVKGTISVLGEVVPASFIDESAELLAPPQPLTVDELLPESLKEAWDGPRSDGSLVHAALSSKRGRYLPWRIVRQVLDDAFRFGLLKRSPESPWPVDLSSAASVKVECVSTANPPLPPHSGRELIAAEVELSSGEIQDLSEHVDEILKAAAGHNIRFTMRIELGGATARPAEAVIRKVNELLQAVNQKLQLH